MARFFVQPRQQITDGNGNPYSGALAYFYVAGTTTPQDTYTDAGRTTPATNPLVADGSGRWVQTYLKDATYRIDVKTSAGVLIYSEDNVDGGKSLTAITTQQTFTSSSGTYTTPTGCRAIRVRMVGGGGAGGGAIATGASQGGVGSGGAAGGYVEKFITSPSATYSYSVGAAGAGASNADGGNGGDTSFGSLTAFGGGGGFKRTPVATAIDVTAGGIGGTSFGGDYNAPGEHGREGWSFVEVGSMLPGNGAPSVFGSGGRFGTPAASGAGVAGTAPGSGGSGAGNLASQSARAGGNGVAGMIIVEEYY